MSARLLVVHEDVRFHDAIAAMLEANYPGSVAIPAVSAPRALGIAEKERPDLIIADGDLEGMDGYALTAAVKADAALRSIPVMIVTAVPSESTSARAREAGASAFMSSGSDASVLVQSAMSLLGDGTAAVQPGSGSGVVPPGVEVGAAGTGVPTRPAAQTANRGSTAATGEPPHVDELLRIVIDRGGSDLHITAGSPPGIRLRGHLQAIEGYAPLTPKDTQAMLLGIMSQEQRRRFEMELELDFAYSLPGVSRFRANIFQQRGSMGAVFRAIALQIPTIAELGLPDVCRALAERPRGLVLVTGPTGSGKSTTLAAMIDHINQTRPVHIVTMEDPIEFMHRNKRAYVNQREVGQDTRSFAAALKRVLRQDPDVILVGELRDLETISAALTAAETGHLVLATVHTTGGPETVDRIIDVFPPHQQQQVRMQLSTTLEGVLSQALIRSPDGSRFVLAMEIMLGIPAIANLIREGKTHQMMTIIQGGNALGMQTLDQHLRSLVQVGAISMEGAFEKAKSPRELELLLGGSTL